MAITTKAKVKTILGITGTTQDALIEALIPLVESDFLNIRNAPWDTKVYGERVGVGNGTQKIFALDNFPLILASEKIYINGVLIASAEYDVNYNTGALTFDTAPIANSRITADYEVVDFFYPDGAELTAIRMIGWHLAQQKSIGVSSESLGDHSVTYEKSATGAESYPASIIGSIKRYVRFS